MQRVRKVVKDVFPQAKHRECFKHLMQNFIKRFGGDIYSKMYPTTRTYRPRVFKYFFNQVVTASPQILEWLENHHKLLWMRSAFNPDIKCDYVTNNLAESFNNWIRDWKDLLIVELADKIREMIVTLWNKRRAISERLHDRILPAALQQLK
jgi:transposase-like protein